MRRNQFEASDAGRAEGMKTARTVWAPASRTLCFLSINATDHGVENSQLGLLDRCNRIVDGEGCFALQPIGKVLCALDIALMFKLGNVSFHIIHIGGYLRLQRAPLLAGSVLDRFYVLVHLFECRCGRSTRLLSTRHHFVLRFLFCCSDGILGILGASGKVSELLRKRFGHVRSPSSWIPSKYREHLLTPFVILCHVRDCRH